jgi:hypothetical protein
MIRSIVSTICGLVMIWPVSAQTPGIDPRGISVTSSPVIIGIVQEPWQRVIRPEKIPKAGKVTQQADGTYIAELPRMTEDYVVGYIYHVRVQEVLKADKWVRANQVIRVFVPHTLEDGVSLPANQRFLLALASYEPKKEDFTGTSVSNIGQSVTKEGVPFNLQARYHRIVGGRNGAISITEEHRVLIEDIRTAIRNAR